MWGRIKVAMKMNVLLPDFQQPIMLIHDKEAKFRNHKINLYDAPHYLHI